MLCTMHWMMRPAMRHGRRLISSMTASIPSIPACKTYCVDLLRQHDRGSYLQLAFLPQRVRAFSAALRAFMIELARTSSSEQMALGERIRLQFWKDSLRPIFDGNPPAEPVATLLAHEIPKFKLTQAFFTQYCNARIARAGSPPFASLGDLENYAEASFAVPLYLSLEAVGHPGTLDHIASSVGKAQGIASVLMVFPFYYSRRVIMLPLDECATAGVISEQVLRHGPDEQLRQAVFAVATRANDYLITADHYMRNTQLSRDDRAIFLQTEPARKFLQRLEKANFNPLDKSLQRMDWSLPVRMFRRS